MMLAGSFTRESDSESDDDVIFLEEISVQVNMPSTEDIEFLDVGKKWPSNQPAPDPVDGERSLSQEEPECHLVEKAGDILQIDDNPVKNCLVPREPVSPGSIENVTIAVARSECSPEFPVPMTRVYLDGLLNLDVENPTERRAVQSSEMNASQRDGKNSATDEMTEPDGQPTVDEFSVVLNQARLLRDQVLAYVKQPPLPLSESQVLQLPNRLHGIERIRIENHKQIESLKKQVASLTDEIAKLERQQQTPNVVHCETYFSNTSDEDRGNTTEHYENDAMESQTSVEQNGHSKQKLPQDICEAIDYSKQTMKNRGLTYNDFVNWAENRGHAMSSYKVGQFLNKWLNEHSSRKIMSIIMEFLEDESIRAGESVLPRLSTQVIEFVDRAKKIMKDRGLPNSRYIAWSKANNCKYRDPRDFGLFMSKKLSERKSRGMMLNLQKFLKSIVPTQKGKNPSRFTLEQRRELQEFFLTEKYPTVEAMERLSQQFQKKRSTIKQWFKTMRRKERIKL